MGVRLLLAAVSALVIAPAAPARAAHFDRAVVVVFENKARDEVLGNSAAPEFNALARRGATLSNYRGITHPSLPNYIALISGSTHGIHSDCGDCALSGRNLADTLEARRRTWKAYAEDLPSTGYTGSRSGGYTKHHNPFVYFNDVLASRARLNRVVSLSALSSDLSHRTLPDFSLVIPNECNDMHNCPVRDGDRWLRRFIGPVLASPQMRRGVVFVIFDEGSGGDGVPAIAVGPAVRRGARFGRTVDHVGLLRTIEDAWGLQRLGRSARATPITGIWR
jgi:phosphatidylinositol-3-phosphatase